MPVSQKITHFPPSPSLPHEGGGGALGRRPVSPPPGGEGPGVGGRRPFSPAWHTPLPLTGGGLGRGSGHKSRSLRPDPLPARPAPASPCQGEAEGSHLSVLSSVIPEARG